MAHLSKSFPRFSHLPAELRLEIITIAIEGATEYRKEWRGNQPLGSLMVLRSRRQVLRAQPFHKQPPSLAQLTCVSIEWQQEIEKRLFKRLCLRSAPGRGSDEDSDLVAFSAVVTGARRRYLSELQLDSYEEHPSNRWVGDEIVGSYPAGCSFTAVISLLRTLGTWALGQDAGVSLTVKLNIELQDLPLHHFKAHIEKLPMVPVVGDLHVNMNPRKFSKSPPALPFLLRKLPRLHCTTLNLGPWYFSSGNAKNSEVQAFSDGLCSATPRLESLTLDLPFLSLGRPERNGLYSGILSGRFVSSIRELSYRLKSLDLCRPIDMSLFFEQFAYETKDREVSTLPSWPNLEVLNLQGSITKRGGAEAGQPEDQFLRRVGRATKFMPQLRSMEIEVKGAPGERPDQMIVLWRRSCPAGRGRTEEFNLAVMNHNPSSWAVSAWKDACIHTKRKHLSVEFMPPISFDENGEEIDDDWQAWGE